MGTKMSLAVARWTMPAEEGRAGLEDAVGEEGGMMYFLSFLALFGKFKRQKLTFECFCAVFQCFFVFEPFF